MSELLIQVDGARREIALLEEGQLVEYIKDDHQAGLGAEDIYLGQAGRVMKNLSAVFVRLARDTEGFLPFSEIPGGVVPHPGDQLLVQVKKPPQGGKAAYLSCDIALPGTLVILMPLSPAKRASKRITDEEEKQRLLALARDLAPQGSGLIMREESQGSQAEPIQMEIDSLWQTWQEIRAEASRRSAPCPIRQAPDALTLLLREARRQPDKLLSNRPDDYRGLGILTQYAENPLQLHEVHHKLNKALRRKVQLKSGATLVIDPCEAMTVIDVNTAQNVLGSDREKALRDTNIEAAEAIARLLRLRRIGGMILIDFIDMQLSDSRAQVLEALKAALARDPVKTAVHGFTSLGLVEMTRKKSQAPLAAETLRTCPLCHGRGHVEEEEETPDA
ncbi:MAG: ribonuclease E/G [Christensenellales bacterium]